MQKNLISSNSEARIYHLFENDGSEMVVKESDNHFLLESEARMLRYLAPYVRVPKVIALEEKRLVMEYIPNDGSCSLTCESEIADILARLHLNSAEHFGFAYDTTIGPFRQSNNEHAHWIDFYREERVLDFASKAREEGRIDSSLFRRIEQFSAHFENYLREPAQPSLLHGDIWSGNVLTRNGHFCALIDPAVYYGHYEMELAFIGMFHTFGNSFYERYGQHQSIEEGFFEERAPVYRLFPYLVHVRAFGGSYLNGVEEILRRFGY